MLCPENNSKDFDEEQCQICKWYFQCYKMEKVGNIYGDNFPNCPAENNEVCNKGKACDSCKDNKDISKQKSTLNNWNEFFEIANIKNNKNLKKISQEDIDDLKLDLEIFGKIPQKES